MFCQSKFNGDISNWNVENVTSLSNAFEDSDFQCDLSNWKSKKFPLLFKTFKNCPAKPPCWPVCERKNMSQVIGDYQSQLPEKQNFAKLKL